jgi:hypothetical protein
MYSILEGVTNMQVETFLKAIEANLSEEAKNRVVESTEAYDRPFMEKIDYPVVFVVSDCGGSVSWARAEYFRDDLWRAKRWGSDYGSMYRFFTYDLETVQSVSAETAGMFLYEEARKLDTLDIPNLNAVSGYIVSFDELLGSVPEHMRGGLEVHELRDRYNAEIDSLLHYMRTDIKRVKFVDPDTQEEQWVEVPVTELRVCFNRFEKVSDEATQSTAFFSVSDMSPEFEPEVKWNWHAQDTSRWLYAGALAISRFETATGEIEVCVSSNH